MPLYYFSVPLNVTGYGVVFAPDEAEALQLVAEENWDNIYDEENFGVAGPATITDVEVE